MKIKTLSTLFILCGFTFVKAQSPIPSVGPWTISGNSQSSTLHDGGVGTLTPDGKLEVKYQPCANQQNGLIVTSLGCSVLQPTYNTAPTDGILLYDPENPPVPVVLPPLSFSPAFSITTAVVPLVNINNKPMFWIRDENPPNNGFPGSLTVTSYSTKFIVLPLRDFPR